MSVRSTGFLDPTGVGVVPERTDDPAAARRLVEREGAVVWIGDGDTAPGIVGVLTAVFADRLVHIGDAVEVRAAGGKDRPDLDAEGHLLRTPLHSDGFALAEGAPDVLALGCVRDVPGGDSFLVDMDRWLAGLSDGDDADRELADFLVTVPLDRTEPGKVISMGPICSVIETGRNVWVRSIRNEPLPDDADPEHTRVMVGRFAERLVDLEARLPRFHLFAGEILIGDNSRLFHGRDPYEDTARHLWRIWGWTTDAARPDTSYVTSDTSAIGFGPIDQQIGTP